MKKKKTKSKFECPKCVVKFTDRFWLRHHIKEEHEIHVSFLSLVSDKQNWGYTYETRKEADIFRKSPPNDILMLGYLAHIARELRTIKDEIKKVGKR